MSAMLRSLFGKKTPQPEFITTQGMSARLEQMFSEAARSIVIVSPYIRLSYRLYDILAAKKKSGVPITVIYREAFREMHVAARAFQRTNLHAKCYLTESAAIIGSMNLYNYSQVNNDEFGIHIRKEDFPETYQKIAAEVERLSRPFVAPPHAAMHRFHI